MMKKRLLSAALSGCMLLTAFPSAYAVSPASLAGIVQSVQTYAATGTVIKDADTTLTGSNYQLTSQVNLTNHLDITGSNVTLDLNGNTLNTDSTVSGDEYTIVVKNGATLTLIDTNTGGKGTVESGDQGAISIESGGTVILKDISITGSVKVQGSFAMTSGSITASSDSGVILQGGTVEIAGGTITSTRTAAVSLLAQSTLKVTGGTINGISARAGTVNISGGEVNSHKPSSGFAATDTEINTTNSPALPAAIYLLPGCGTLGSGTPTLNITDGEIIGGTDCHGVAVYVGGSRNQASKVDIKGGTIKGGTGKKAVGLYYRDAASGMNWNSAAISITGGKFSSDPAKFNPDPADLPTGVANIQQKIIPAANYSAAENNGEWEVKPAISASNGVKVVGDDTAGAAIPSPTITITDTTAQKNPVTTMTDGQKYLVTVSATNYKTATEKEITASSTNPPTITLERKKGTLTVTPTLYDGEKPAAGATTTPQPTTGDVTVTVQEGTQTIETKPTVPSQSAASFSGLKVGANYTVTCSAPGYGTETKNVTILETDVKQNTTDQYEKSETVDLYQVRSVLKFNVKEGSTDVGAQITVTNKTNSTPVTPSATGEYQLNIGEYTYTITAPDYYDCLDDNKQPQPSLSGEIKIEQSNLGQSITKDITLQRKTADLKVTVSLEDATTGDISLELKRTTGGTSEKQTVKAGEEVTLSKLRQGEEYELTASKTHYSTQTKKITIDATNPAQTITLQRANGLSTISVIDATTKTELPSSEIKSFSIWKGDKKGDAADALQPDTTDPNVLRYKLEDGVEYFYELVTEYHGTKSEKFTGVFETAVSIEVTREKVPVTITPNVPDAQVTVVDKDGAAVTAADGKYVLTIGETYKYSVSATGYRPIKDIEFTAATDKTEIQVELKEQSDSYTAVFDVKTANGKPIANATVTIGTKTATTDLNGQCSIDGLTESSYDYTVQASGYTTVKGKIEGADQRETDQVLLSDALQAQTYQVRFIFQAGSETVDPGAALTVLDGDGITVQPNADGAYTLKQPEVSQYIVKNNPSTFDYQTVSGTVQYNASASGVQTVTVPLTKVARDYQVAFKVTGQAEGVTPVVKYGEGTATTDIPATENGYAATLQNNRSYVYTVSAEGYQTVSGSIPSKENQTALTIPVQLVETGKVFTLQLNLYSTDATVANPSAATVNVIMKDSDGNIVSPIDNAANRFYLDTTKTYTYTVVADGFAPATGKVETGTAVGMVKEELVALTPYSRNYTLSFAITSADGVMPNDVKVSVKENENELTVENNQVALMNNHAYTYTVTATGKNPVSGAINTKTDTAAETLSIVLTNTTTVPETKVVVKNDTPWSGGSTIEQAAIVSALAQTEIPATTAAAIGAAAEKNRTAILTNAGADSQSTTLRLKTYLQIEPQTYTATADGKTLVVDIKPMAQVVDETDKYVGEPQQLHNLAEAMWATVALPRSFVTDIDKDWVYINHNSVEHTRSHMDKNNQVRFMTTGFSPFTFSTKDAGGNVAYIQETGKGFTSLQAAVEQVQDRQTIEVTTAGTLEATVNRVVSFYATTPNGATITIKNGYGTVIAPLDALYVISEAKPDNPNNPDNPDNPADPDYNPTDGYRIRVSHGSHGSVSISHSRAKSGTTVTVKIRPDAGYEMAEIEVLDKNQDSITTRRRTDEEYTFRMPDSTVTVDVSFRSYESNRADTSDDVTTEHGVVPFPDVQRKDWFYSAVKYVYDRGIMDGKGVGFAPDAPVTRGMVVTILYRMDGKPSASESQFSDVQPGQYYSVPVSWAARHDIVNGYGNGQFRPNDSITREQFATILYRFAQYKNYSTSAAGSLLQYTDASNISDFAIDAMRWANGNRLITGVTETALMPNGNATRAQAAAIIQRFCKEVAYY